jgi:multiple sugar transport system substrate-binding protein
MSVEKKKMKPFQLAIFIIAIVIAVVAVGVFSKSDRSQQKQGSGEVNYGAVSIWGTVPNNQEVAKIFKEFNSTYTDQVFASYVYVPPEDLEQKLLEALSNEQGPDVLILPLEWLQKNILRIVPIGYDPQKGGISQRDFKDTFTQAGEVFLYPEGIMALPLAIDPLVMYWNRDLFSNAGIVTPPTTWKEVLTLTKTLTKKKNLDITQGAIALGEYENVIHAKDILSLMFLQVGAPITQIGSGGKLLSTLGTYPAVAQAVRFYTDFSNPLKSSYSWNRSLPSSQEMFLSGDLAMYVDFASVNKTLLTKNPRLNFDLAPVPQTEGQETFVTYGKIHGIAVLKRGKNTPGGVAFAKLFAGKKYADVFAKAAGLAPMRRDLLSVPQSDAFTSILYSASLRARSWIDPQPMQTDSIFARMINSVLSGENTPDIAVTKADLEINSLLQPK